MQKKQLFLSLLAIVVQACSVPGLVSGSAPICAQPLHDIVSNSHFQLLWANARIYPLQSDTNPMIQGLPPNMFVGVQDENHQASVIAFEIEKGNFLWKEPVTLPVNLLASGDNLYVASYDKIGAHDVETGEQTKVINLPKVGVIGNMYESDQSLDITTGNGSWIIYDTQKDKAEISDPLLPYLPFVLDNEILYMNDAEGLKALDVNTHSTLWNYEIADPITSHPLFTNHRIIVLTQTNKVYVLNKNTGDLLWNQSFPVVSNLATDSHHLFFLTPNGSLKVIDIQSGQEIQSLEFSPASFQISTSNTTIGGYNIWIDSQENIIVVSLGDSCQLMAIKFDLP